MFSTRSVRDTSDQPSWAMQLQCCMAHEQFVEQFYKKFQRSNERNSNQHVAASWNGRTISQLTFLDLLSEETRDTKVVDLRSCAIHSEHGSFQYRHKATGWNINGYL